MFLWGTYCLCSCTRNVHKAVGDSRSHGKVFFFFFRSVLRSKKKLEITLQQYTFNECPNAAHAAESLDEP